MSETNANPTEGTAVPPSKSELPTRMVVLVCRLKHGGLMPVTRFDQRTDGHWVIESGAKEVLHCLTPLAEAHECCLGHATQLAAESAAQALQEKFRAGMKGGTEA